MCVTVIIIAQFVVYLEPRQLVCQAVSKHTPLAFEISLCVLDNVVLSSKLIAFFFSDMNHRYVAASYAERLCGELVRYGNEIEQERVHFHWTYKPRSFTSDPKQVDSARHIATWHTLCSATAQCTNKTCQVSSDVSA